MNYSWGILIFANILIGTLLMPVNREGSNGQFLLAAIMFLWVIYCEVREIKERLK